MFYEEGNGCYNDAWGFWVSNTEGKNTLISEPQHIENLQPEQTFVN